MKPEVAVVHRTALVLLRAKTEVHLQYPVILILFEARRRNS